MMIFGMPTSKSLCCHSVFFLGDINALVPHSVTSECIKYEFMSPPLLILKPDLRLFVILDLDSVPV